MRRNSGIIGPKIVTDTDAAPGVHDLFDNYNAEKLNAWPITKKVIGSVLLDNGTNLNENVTNTITINTEGFDNGHTLYYSIVTVSGPTLTGADFNSGSLTGSFNISGGVGSFTVKPLGDDLAENNTCKIQIRKDSVSGTILAESAVLAITDAAAPIGDDITSSFYEISNRFIASNTYEGGGGDYSGPYDVGEVQTDFTGSGRIYVGVKVTASTVYYNDIPIAGIQIRTGTTLLASWIFNSNTGGSGSGWQTYSGQINGSSTQGFPVTPETASGYTYSNITTSTNVSRFSWATSTGSSNTGAADGIGDTYKLSADGGSNTLASVGDAQIAQSSNTYYVFRETSGSSRWSGTVMRSPSYTFSGGEYIRIIHALTGPSNNQMDPDDSLYIGVY